MTHAFRTLGARLAVVAGSLTAAIAGSQTLDNRFEQAMMAYEAGHYVEAALLLREPAKAGHRQAQEALGMMHLYGAQLYGDGQWSRSAAIEWLRRASENGSETARYVRSKMAWPVALADHGCL